MAWCQHGDQVRRLEYHDVWWMAAVLFSSGDIAEKVAKIKQQPGPDLHVWGSGNLIQTLIKHDLVDVFWLMIYPITLGGGKRLFADGTIPAAFKVTESVVTPKGVIVVNYEHAHLPSGGARGRNHNQFKDLKVGLLNFYNLFLTASGVWHNKKPVNFACSGQVQALPSLEGIYPCQVFSTLWRSTPANSPPTANTFR